MTIGITAETSLDIILNAYKNPSAAQTGIEVTIRIQSEDQTSTDAWQMASGTVTISFDPTVADAINNCYFNYGIVYNQQMSNKKTFFTLTYPLELDSLTESLTADEKLYFELFMPAPTYHYMNDEECVPYPQTNDATLH